MYNNSIYAVLKIHYYRFVYFLQVFFEKSRSIDFSEMLIFLDFTAFLWKLILATEIDRLLLYLPSLSFMYFILLFFYSFAES